MALHPNEKTRRLSIGVYQGVYQGRKQYSDIM